MANTILIYEPYIHGLYGNTNYLLLIFRLIDNKKFRIILIAPSESRFTKTVESYNIETIILTPPSILNLHGGKILSLPFWKKIQAAFGILQYTKKIISIIKREDVKIIHCHNIRALITIGLSSLLTNCPCVWYVKGELKNPMLDRIGLFLACRIIFLSNKLKSDHYKYLYKLFNNKLIELRIGVDLKKIEEIKNCDSINLRQELDIKKDYINIAFMGTISPDKGVFDLIKSIEIISKNVDCYRLYIIGDPCVAEYVEYKKEISSYVINKNLYKSVIFTGWRNDPINILSLMDIYTLPSLSEGVPRSIVEAMVLGKPVVATNVGGISDIIDDGITGFIVPPGDVDNIASALLNLISNPHLRKAMSVQAELKVKKLYNIKKNIKGLEQIYSDLLR